MNAWRGHKGSDEVANSNSDLSKLIFVILH